MADENYYFPRNVNKSATVWERKFHQYPDPTPRVACGKSRLKFGCFEPMKGCGYDLGLVPDLRLQENAVLANRGNRNGDCRNPATYRPLNDTTYL